jgi:hypothetical protein
MSEKKIVPTKSTTALKTPESAAKLIASLKASKILNLDVPMSTVESLLHTPGIEEVAGYVLAWDKYVLVVGKDSIASNPIEMTR